MRRFVSVFADWRRRDTTIYDNLRIFLNAKNKSGSTLHVTRCRRLRAILLLTNNMSRHGNCERINERGTGNSNRNGKCLILIEIFNPLMPSSICLKSTSKMNEARSRNIANCMADYWVCTYTPRHATQRIPVNPFSNVYFAIPAMAANREAKISFQDNISDNKLLAWIRFICFSHRVHK